MLSYPEPLSLTKQGSLPGEDRPESGGAALLEAGRVVLRGGCVPCISN